MHRSSPSLREQVHALLKKATGYGNTFEAQRLFAGMTGSLALAVLINQLLYWSERTTRRDGSVFKSSADWEQELHVTGYAVRQFKKLPFIETTVQRANAYPTTHYRIRGEMLLAMVTQYLASQSKTASGEGDAIDSTDCTVRPQSPALSTITSVETDKSLTDITSDITPVNTTTRGPTQKTAPPGHSDTDLETVNTRKTNPEAEGPARFSQEAPPGVFGMIQAALAEGPVRTEGAARVSQPEGAARCSQHSAPYITALALVTGCDPQLRSHAARLARVARELMQAGYTPENIRGFAGFWRANDFRWKKDKQLPTPEDVLAQIPRSKRSPRDDLRESWRELIRNQYRSTGEE